MKAPYDHRKQSFYFPKHVIEEIREEAERLDRTYSYVMQRAWAVAKSEIAKIPSMPEVES